MICLLALTTVVSVIIINIHHRGEIYPRPSRFVRVLVLRYLATLVWMRHLVPDTVNEVWVHVIATSYDTVYVMATKQLYTQMGKL